MLDDPASILKKSEERGYAEKCVFRGWQGEVVGEGLLESDLVYGRSK